MSRLDIVQARAEHAAVVVPRMRGPSVADVQKIGVDFAVGALEAAIDRSRFAWTAFIEGDLACVWGVETPTLLSDQGMMWMITTPAIEDHIFTFVRRGRLELAHLRQEFSLIHGWVDTRFDQSIRWLRWLGFTVHDPQGHCPRLRWFEMRRD